MEILEIMETVEGFLTKLIPEAEITYKVERLTTSILFLVHVPSLSRRWPFIIGYDQGRRPENLKGFAEMISRHLQPFIQAGAEHGGA